MIRLELNQLLYYKTYMKHLRLYENFIDPLRGARDLFDLTSSFTKTKRLQADSVKGSEFSSVKALEFTGPVEYEEEARKIADEGLKMGDIQAALASIGWEVIESPQDIVRVHLPPGDADSPYKFK